MKKADFLAAPARRSILLLPVALAACVVVPARRVEPAPVVVVDVPRAPPPPRVEVVPVAPGPAYFWVAGHWRWERGEHVWIPGHWEAARAGYRWVPAHWEAAGPNWRYVGGHWAPN